MISYLCGDCRRILPTLPEGSIHCCITSPPYWGLRDYGTGHWEGGVPGCTHDPGGKKQVPHAQYPSVADSVAAGGNRQADRVCRRCGAMKVDLQLGLEPTPEEYVEHLVEVFREVRRVLRDDGT